MEEFVSMAPPIEWPRFKIGGHDLELRYSFAVIYRLSKAGVNVLDPNRVIAARVEQFAVMVAHNFTLIGQPAPSADYWAERIEDNGHWKAMVEAIDSAVAKAPQAKSPANPPAEKVVPPANPVN